MAFSGCGGPSSPQAPPGVMPPSDAVTVRGTERFAWAQPGDVTNLDFRGYVDQAPVALDAATCDDATPATCSSPLPPLTDGLHRIAVTAVSRTSGLESSPSVALTVHKVPASASARVMSGPWRPAPAATAPRTEAATRDGLVHAADTIATGVRAPAHLACDPDGRLFVAQADGRVRILVPGEREDDEPALDARALLRLPPAGPLGIALDPAFSANHFAYLAFLAQDRPGRTLLRVVRLREVGRTLGEPVGVFDALVNEPASEASDVSLPGRSDGPRLAFGPDHLMYVALPPGVEFDDDPAASLPHRSMLRLAEDGRVPSGIAPITDVVRHPAAFDWHPSTGALWIAFPGDDGETVLRSIDLHGERGEGAVVRIPIEMGKGMIGALRFRPATEREPMRVFLAAPASEGLTIVTFTHPVRAETLLAETLGRIGDITAGPDATLFVATRNAERGEGVSGTDVVVRLMTRAR